MNEQNFFSGAPEGKLWGNIPGGPLPPEQPPPPPPTTNITRQEHLALQNLNRDTDIIVLPADKGNTTVVMNTSDYKKKMKNLLSYKAYKSLTKIQLIQSRRTLRSW